MAFRSTPQLGPGLEDVFSGTDPFWFEPDGDTPSPRLGNPEMGTDGHTYVWVRAGGSQIAASTAVQINETTWVATAGAGGFTTPPSVVPANAYFWARKTAI
jgi:hypothetical protein